MTQERITELLEDRFHLMEQVAALQEKLDQYRTEYFQTLRERDEYRQAADDQAMAHKVERDALRHRILLLLADRYQHSHGSFCTKLDEILEESK